MEIGSPRACEIDNNKLTIFCRKPTNDILSLWKSSITYQSAKVFLSGGIDSEFSLCLIKECVPNVTAHVFVYVWNDVVVNSHDVVNARRIANKHNVKITSSEHNLKNILDFDLNRLAETYVTTSPQISAHLSALEGNCFGADVYVLGGEIPMVLRSSNGNLVPVFLERGMYYVFNTIAPFVRFGNMHKIPVIRNPFMLSDEILFAGYAQNTLLIEQGLEFKSSDLPLSGSILYKQAYYDTFGYGLQQQILKRSGFETIKMHLASITGNYDEFDRKYRYPLQKRMNMPTRKVKVRGDQNNLIDILNNTHVPKKIKYLNTYTFDW